MEEFNNRMDSQRIILNIINKQRKNKEELCSLSKKAINRWIMVNQLNPENKICSILYTISDKLSFLATKSQEQISEEYRQLSRNIMQLRKDLEKVMR